MFNFLYFPKCEALINATSSAFWSNVWSGRALDSMTSFGLTMAYPDFQVPISTKLFPSVKQSTPGLSRGSARRSDLLE